MMSPLSNKSGLIPACFKPTSKSPSGTQLIMNAISMQPFLSSNKTTSSPNLNTSTGMRTTNHNATKFQEQHEKISKSKDGSAELNGKDFFGDRFIRAGK